MKFDLNTDIYAQKSIKFLRDNGMNFEPLRLYGCNQRDVINGLQQLFTDDNITWVTFHG